jgi:hypothetical protein
MHEDVKKEVLLGMAGVLTLTLECICLLPRLLNFVTEQIRQTFKSVWSRAATEWQSGFKQSWKE